MKKREFPYWLVIILLCLCAAFYWAYKNIEFTEQSYFSSPSKEVRANPFIAAARLLEQAEGFEYNMAKDQTVFSKLATSNTGVLWLTDANDLQDKRDAESIIAWVKNGGVLLTSPAGNNIFDDSSVPGWFMQQLGLETTLSLSENRATRIRGTTPFDLIPITSSSADTTSASGDNVIDQLLISIEYESYFRTGTNDSDESQTIIDTQTVVHRSLGEGFYTVLSNDRLLANTRIKRFDSSYLLLWVTEPAKDKTITIVYRPADKPSLFSVLWSNFSVAIATLGIALIGFLRWASLRLGPVEQELPPINNNLIAHLEARGEYWYRHKHTDKVFAEAQQAAIEQLSPHQRHAARGEQMSEAEREAIIDMASEKLGINRKKSHRLLFGQPKNKSSVLRETKLLQKILHRKLVKEN